MTTLNLLILFIPSICISFILLFVIVRFPKMFYCWGALMLLFGYSLPSYIEIISIYDKEFAKNYINQSFQHNIKLAKTKNKEKELLYISNLNEMLIRRLHGHESLKDFKPVTKMSEDDE